MKDIARELAILAIQDVADDRSGLAEWLDSYDIGPSVSLPAKEYFAQMDPLVEQLTAELCKIAETL